MQAKINEYADGTKESEKEDSFQETEAGLIPSDWKVVKLGEIADYVNGFAFKPTQWKDEGLPIIRIQNLTGNVDKYNYFDGEIDSRYLVRDGDLLISWSASLGVFLWKGGNAWLNQHIFKVTNLSSNVSKMFLYYVLQHRLFSIIGKIRGSTMKHITRKEFVATLIPLSPFLEQQKIARVLGTIQRAIEQQDKIIEAAKNLKKSLMQKLFTEGLGHIEFKETEIGEIPASWEVVRLGDVGIFQYGYTTSAIEERTGVKFLRITDIKEEGNMFWENVPYCKLSENELEKYRLAEGDILFARIGATTGKTCIIESPPISTFGSYLIRLQIKEKSKFSPKFIYYFTNTDNYWTWINANKEGKLKKGISASFLKTLPIPLPSLSEQQEIARILSTLDEKIEVEEKRRATLNELFKTMLHKLMTGEIRLKDVEV